MSNYECRDPIKKTKKRKPNLKGLRNSPQRLKISDSATHGAPLVYIFVHSNLYCRVIFILHPLLLRSMVPGSDHGLLLLYTIVAVELVNYF